jgi:hypothetical protein
MSTVLCKALEGVSESLRAFKSTLPVLELLFFFLRIKLIAFIISTNIFIFTLTLLILLFLVVANNYINIVDAGIISLKITAATTIININYTIVERLIFCNL